MFSFSSIEHYHAQLKQGNATCVHAVQHYLASIEKNKHLNCFLEVFADEAIIKERLSRSGTDSDADFEIYKSVKNQWEPFSQDHLLLLESTNNNITDMLEKTADYLFSKNDNTKH